MMEADHRGEREAGGGGSDNLTAVFDPLRLAIEEEEDRSPGSADLERLKGLVEDENFSCVHRAAIRRGPQFRLAPQACYV